MIDLAQLPSISAIYRVWYQGRVIYVGQTVNLKKRWQNHHILAKIVCKYGTDWTIDWVEISPSNLNRAEAFAYRSFQPELNQKDPSGLLGREP
ncbi:MULTISPECIES: GIY-YIG nuclease family protein [Leptolyngbya]|uniref:GIY-YIG nuclease family protein n=1 Tax=Leptolyngbya TaxID=47251 RepID=UPI0016825CEC|nr:GIY-YIG nuclease family protein [Leptolyngbya sp. FACHB-1624]MBD1855165.1 GIY-YIG nuclease family protein [Leptolyngbya sp. FACHB-1624]